MKRPGMSGGDDVGPPTAEAFPASCFLTTRFFLVGQSVRVVERLFFVALSSLIRVFSLASAISSGSK